jgi:hypothetical protein
MQCRCGFARFQSREPAADEQEQGGKKRMETKLVARKERKLLFHPVRDDEGDLNLLICAARYGGAKIKSGERVKKGLTRFGTL